MFLVSLVRRTINSPEIRYMHNTATSLNIVVEGKQGHPPCKVLSLQKIIFSAPVELHENLKTVTILR